MKKMELESYLTPEQIDRIEKLRQKFILIKRANENLSEENQHELRIESIQSFGIDVTDFDLNDKKLFLKNLLLMMFGLGSRNPEKLKHWVQEAKEDGAID